MFRLLSLRKSPSHMGFSRMALKALSLEDSRSETSVRRLREYLCLDKPASSEALALLVVGDVATRPSCPPVRLLPRDRRGQRCLNSLKTQPCNDGKGTATNITFNSPSLAEKGNQTLGPRVPPSSKTGDRQRSGNMLPSPRQSDPGLLPHQWAEARNPGTQVSQ